MAKIVNLFPPQGDKDKDFYDLYIKLDDEMKQAVDMLKIKSLDEFVALSSMLGIDLFDDEVERIRKFDVMSQRTTSELKSYTFKVMSEVVLDTNTVKTFRSKYREAFGADFSGDEMRKRF